MMFFRGSCIANALTCRGLNRNTGEHASFPQELLPHPPVAVQVLCRRSCDRRHDQLWQPPVPAAELPPADRELCPCHRRLMA
jgi:hypothetical protein